MWSNQIDMRYFILCIIILAVFFLQSCCRKPDQAIITKRIQYDVTIKSPDPDLNWWVQNIEGSSRETYLSHLFYAVYEGKVPAYDPWGYNEMSPKQAAMVGRRYDTIRLMRPTPPYDDYDTVITRSFTLDDITRLRFMEQWETDTLTMQFSKKIIGIAPLLQSFDHQGNLRGYSPMFWVFFDPSYPAVLQEFKYR